MKKNLVTALLALCITAGAAAPAGAAIQVSPNDAISESPDISTATEDIRSDTNTQGDYTYSILEDGSIAITGYAGTAAQLVIPAEIDGKQVSAIESRAFKDCTSLEDIIIPEGVTAIGESAFDGCSNLKSAALPKSLTHIPSCIFNRCDSLETAAIPEGITKICDEAFFACTGLKSITIPSSVQNIGWCAFAGCESLKDITLSEGALRYIDDAAFSGCSSLETITIPEGVTHIGEYSFSECTSLKSITIPTTTFSIASGAFRQCSNLKDIYFAGSRTQRKKINIMGSGNKNLLNAVFHYGKSGTSERLAPKKGTVLKSENNYYAVTPNTAQAAFTKTKNTEPKLFIPSYVNLDGITYTVTSVSDNALQNNKKITKVTLDSKITSIGRNAFSGCSNLSTIVIKTHDLARVRSNAFKGIKSNAKIKVSSGYLDSYKKLLAGKGQGSRVTIKPLP